MSAPSGRVSFVVLTQYPEPELSARIAALRALPLTDAEIVVVHDLPAPDALSLENADQVSCSTLGLADQRELGRRHATGATVLVLEPGRTLHPEVAAAVIDLYGRPVGCEC